MTQSAIDNQIRSFGRLTACPLDPETRATMARDGIIDTVSVDYLGGAFSFVWRETADPAPGHQVSLGCFSHSWDALPAFFKEIGHADILDVTPEALCARLQQCGFFDLSNVES
jgi:hypothetical protein